MPLYGLSQAPLKNKFPSLNVNVNSVEASLGDDSYTATQHNDDSPGGWAKHKADLNLFILTNGNVGVVFMPGTVYEFTSRISRSLISTKAMILKALCKTWHFHWSITRRSHVNGSGQVRPADLPCASCLDPQHGSAEFKWPRKMFLFILAQRV